MIWGLQPGPMLFVEQKDFVWGLIASMYLGNIVGLIIVLTCVPLFAAILRVPFSIIAPIILVICAVGAYTVHNSMFDVWLMLAFGVAGYVFTKLGYPLPPLVLAIVLGDKAEESFRQAMLSSQGNLTHLLVELAGGIDHDARPVPAALAACDLAHGQASQFESGNPSRRSAGAAVVDRERSISAKQINQPNQGGSHDGKSEYSTTSAGTLCLQPGCCRRPGRSALMPASPAVAQAWEPTKPIQFIIPAGTGGGADQMARFIQGVVAKNNLAKQPIITVNKGGGAGRRRLPGGQEDRRRPTQHHHHAVEPVHHAARHRRPLQLEGHDAGRHAGARPVRPLGAGRRALQDGQGVHRGGEGRR